MKKVSNHVERKEMNPKNKKTITNKTKDWRKKKKKNKKKKKKFKKKN